MILRPHCRARQQQSHVRGVSARRSEIQWSVKAGESSHRALHIGDQGVKQQYTTVGHVWRKIGSNKNVLQNGVLWDARIPRNGRCKLPQRCHPVTRAQPRQYAFGRE
jgi:hypothetical protein